MRATPRAIVIASGRGDAATSRPTSGRSRQVVGEVGENLNAVVGDEKEILRTTGAESLPKDARLDRNYVAGHEVLAARPERAWTL